MYNKGILNRVSNSDKRKGWVIVQLYYMEKFTIAHITND